MPEPNGLPSAPAGPPAVAFWTLLRAPFEATEYTPTVSGAPPPGLVFSCGTYTWLPSGATEPANGFVYPDATVKGEPVIWLRVPLAAIVQTPIELPWFQSNSSEPSGDGATPKGVLPVGNDAPTDVSVPSAGMFHPRSAPVLNGATSRGWAFGLS